MNSVSGTPVNGTQSVTLEIETPTVSMTGTLVRADLGYRPVTILYVSALFAIRLHLFVV